MNNYLVACDHPFYPEVDYFNTLEETNTYAEEQRVELFKVLGERNCTISVCKLLHRHEGKSDY